MGSIGDVWIEKCTPYEKEIATIYKKFEDAEPDLAIEMTKDFKLFFTDNDNDALQRVYAWRDKAKERFQIPTMT